MLSHLLAKSGIESIVLEKRSRQEIEETNRAGILEQSSVTMLVDSGVSDRVLKEGCYSPRPVQKSKVLLRGGALKALRNTGA